MRGLPAAMVCLALAIGPAAAGEAEVVKVKVQVTADGLYRIAATLRHGDTGWDHYADRWEVVAPDGKVLGTRVLRHPHVEEQPFTRSLSALAIPSGIATVTIRAHDSVHGYGARVSSVKLPGR